MGLAVTGSSYIVEVKMPESNSEELQRDFMFKWKMVEFSKGTWILIHKDFIRWAGLSWPGAHRNPPKNMSRQVMVVLSPVPQGKEHFQQPHVLWKVVQCPDMSNSMGFQQDKQDRGTFFTVSKKKAKFMTILAFQEYSFPSPEPAFEGACHLHWSFPNSKHLC